MVFDRQNIPLFHSKLINMQHEMPYSCCLDDDENVRPFPEIDCSKEAKDLLLRLLHPDPSQRLRNLITMARLAFFKDFNIAAAVDMTVDTQVPVNIPN